MDYLTRDGLEHKVERELVQSSNAAAVLSPFINDAHHPLLGGLRSRTNRLTVIISNSSADSNNNSNNGNINSNNNNMMSSEPRADLTP